MAFLAEKLLENRSVFVSAPWAGDEKGLAAAIKHLWSLLQGEDRGSQAEKPPM